MRIVRAFTSNSSVFPGYKQPMPSHPKLPQDFQDGATQAYKVLLQRLAAYEFDRLKDITELTFWKLLKKKVSLLVEDGLELSLVGSAVESEVSLVSATKHIGAVLPLRNLNPCLSKYDVTEASPPFEFRYAYKSASDLPASFAKFPLTNLKKLNEKADLSDFQLELSHLYALLNAYPLTIHRRIVEINSSLRLQVLDPSGHPVGNSPETQLHRLTFEMLDKTQPSNTEAAEWFSQNLEEVSESWVLVDVDETMDGNSLIRNRTLA